MVTSIFLQVIFVSLLQLTLTKGLPAQDNGSCKTKLPGYTWTFNVTNDVALSGIYNSKDCGEKCQETEWCYGYTWQHSDVTGSMCHMFHDLKNLHECSSCSKCISGKFQPVSGHCLGTGLNASQHIIDIHEVTTEMQCHHKCLTTPKCQFYSFSSKNLSSMCFLLTVCFPTTSCEGWQSAAIACFPEHLFGLNVTVKDIDECFITATKKLQISSQELTANNTNLAAAINEATAILVQDMGLDKKVIPDMITKVDTSKSIIAQYCPSTVQKRNCTESRYQEIDGSCNNLQHSDWGSANTAFTRFLDAKYNNGISAIRSSVSGKELPSARLVSSLVHKDKQVQDHPHSSILVVWGQFIAHEISLTEELPKMNCCKEPKLNNSACLPIQISDSDSFFSKHQQECMNFVRSSPSLRTGCRLGAREQFNKVSSVLDGSTVYSNDQETLRKLRTFTGGKMKTLSAFKHLGLKDLLPLKKEDPDKLCSRPNNDSYCFFAGEPRLNEQTLLAIVHLLFVREHNRLAEELQQINPHWSDQILFQETRRIVGALMQHITINEYLPALLGYKGIKRYGLDTKNDGYYTGYDKNIDPSASSGFSTAAFRFGHSQIPSTIERWSKTHQYIASQQLMDMFFKPYDLLKAGWTDQYILGMLNQRAQATDDLMSVQLTNHLFGGKSKSVGRDLAALNIQRGRDHGLPPYNSWRKWCGLKPIKSWSDLSGVMMNNSIHDYPKVYQSAEDIDLFTGGLSEIHQDGATLGPTFSCIIGRQFYNLRAGDRFWYENGDWMSSFTLEQLQQIRKISLARLICDNSDDIESVQIKAMLVHHHQDNPRSSCESGIIPRLDLTPWKQNQ